MKTYWLAAIPVSLTLLLVFIIFVPVIREPSNGIWTDCNGQICVSNIVQYESISYAYGAWGAVFHTGVNWYYVSGWVCYCTINATNCCVAPFAGIIWPVVGLLFLADLLSIVVITRRLTRENHRASKLSGKECESDEKR